MDRRNRQRFHASSSSSSDSQPRRRFDAGTGDTQVQGWIENDSDDDEESDEESDDAD